MLRKLASLIVAFALLATTLPLTARAVSIDEARAACIARVRLSVVACVHDNVLRHGGWPRSYVAQCREPAIPRVRACVFRTLAASGHPALAGRDLSGRMTAICPHPAPMTLP
jgi:hypothetical protein